MLGELSESKKKSDRQVLETLDVILIELTARIEKQERARKVNKSYISCIPSIYAHLPSLSLNPNTHSHAHCPSTSTQARDRLRLNVGVILDDGFARRSTRTRKEVKYTFDDYDEMINGALRCAHECLSIFNWAFFAGGSGGGGASD